ncbi:MAG: NAD(P)-binding domain-containing protein [Pseudomonadales bacterium]|nr:NAD(P)-binding domain-containing protein [Pseudomonadales bacterium]
MNKNAKKFQVLIIGAGPAGLSAAATAAKLNLDYCLLESSDKIAQTLQSFSLGKPVMAEPGFLPLRADLPFAADSRENILTLWHKEIESQQLNIRYHSKVIGISGERPHIEVKLSNGETLSSQTLLLCLGQQGNPRSLNIKNSDSRFITHLLHDSRDYKDKKITIVGAGDSAIEDAISLSRYGEVTLVNRGKDFPKAKPANRSKILKAISLNVVQHLQLSQITALNESDEQPHCDIEISHKEKPDKITLTSHKIITRLGAISPKGFMQDCGITFEGIGEQSMPKLDKNYQSSVKGLFVLGALSGTPLIKQAMNQAHDCICLIAGKAKKPLENLLIEHKLHQHNINSSTEIFVQHLQKITPLFTSLSFLDMREILLQAEISNLAQNSVIFEHHQFSDELLLVVEGETGLKANNAHIEADKQSFIVKPGGFFGESALLTGQAHNITATTQSHSIIVRIPGFLIRKLMAKNPDIKQQIQDVFMLRYISWFLACDLPSNLIALFLKDIELIQLNKQQTLFEKGQIPADFYLVRNGAFITDHEGLIATDNKSRVEDVYHSGQHIAAYEALHQLPMPHRIIASVKSSAIKIPQKILVSLLEISAHFKQQIQHSEQQRLMRQQHLQIDHHSGQALNFFMQQGLGEAGDVLIINKSQCIACDMCETACAATHEGNSRLNRKAGSVYLQFHVPSACRHCEQPNCMLDCPSNSIHRMESGEVVIDDTCIGCGNCATNCDYGVISLCKPKSNESVLNTWWNNLFSKNSSCAEQADDDGGIARAVKCDLCEGKKSGPACVSACPTGAARRIKPSELINLVTL